MDQKAVPTLRALVFFIILSAAPSLGFAQDTRTVTEPHFPPVCATLKAELAAKNGAIAEPDEKRADTLRIQQAIDRCKPGNAVELRGDGTNNAFLAGPIELKAGITLMVAPGTTLFGSRDPRDYDVTPGSCGLVDQNGRGCKPLIHLRKALDAGVMGDGVIDGRGGARLAGQNVTWWDLAQKAKVDNARQNVPRIIVADESNNFTLYRITLRNSPNFHVIVSRTDGFTAWGVKIDSPKTARNTDGIDPSSSTNVSILYSFIRCGDDNVAIKAGGGGPATHITVAHNHFYTGHGMSIGSETDGGVSAIEVRDLTIDGADNGLRIKSNSTRGGLVHQVSYSNVCIRGVKNPIVMDPFYSTERGQKAPDFQDIRLHNIFIATPGKITLVGLDADHPLKITFDGLQIKGLRAEDVRAAHARIAIGAGGSSLKPAGEDVAVSGTPGSDHNTVACGGDFVPFPALAETQPRRNDRPAANQASSARAQTNLIVAGDGTGDFRSVQQAIDALPPDGGLIKIRPGVYRETVAITKPHVRLEGASDPSTVTIVFDKSAGTAGGTLKSATVSVRADDFFARGITFANDFSRGRELAPQGSQAVALLVTGDRAVFRNMRFLGAQDTLYAGSKSCASEQGPCVPARQYFADCYIEGNVDFIFGDAKAFFERCEIHAIPHQIVMLTAQSKHYAAQESGFVFDKCKITADPGAQQIFLGRPWRPYATVVFVDADLEAGVEPAGWREWHPGETNSLETAFYAEFKSGGPGSGTRQRDSHSKQLSAREVRAYSLQEFLSRPDGWNPAQAR
jgi:polygalacturonase